MMHTIYMGKLIYLNFELEFKNSIDDLLPLGRIAPSTDRAQSASVSERSGIDFQVSFGCCFHAIENCNDHVNLVINNDNNNNNIIIIIIIIVLNNFFTCSISNLSQMVSNHFNPNTNYQQSYHHNIIYLKKQRFKTTPY